MKILNLTTLLILFSLALQSNAQTPNSTVLKPWQMIGFAKRYEVMGDKQSAIKLYNQYLTYKPNAKLHLKVADLYYDIHDYRSANAIYKKYMNEPNNQGYLAKYKYARTLKITMNYSEARELLSRFKEKTMNPVKLGINSELLANELKGCDLAIQFKDTVVRTIVKPLNRSINKWHTEMAAMYINNNKIVYASTNLDSLAYYSTEHEQNAPKIQFYEASKKDSIWVVNGFAKEPFGKFADLNSGSGCFSTDKQRFYFSKGEMNWKYQTIYKLYVTTYSKGIWTEPKEIGGNSNLKGFSSAQPTIGNCYDPSLEVIYFVSDRPGGQGGTDIWYTVYSPSTKSYELAQNAGIYINSVGDELTPFFDMSSHSIYFSSNGWLSIGGLDVFKSSGDLVNWTEPKNIGVPINSSFDDLYYNLLPNSNRGFVTSNRTDMGDRPINNYFDDIFEFQESTSERVWITGTLYSDDLANESNVFKTTNKQATVLVEEKMSLKTPLNTDKLTSSQQPANQQLISPTTAIKQKQTAISNATVSLRLQQDSSKSVLLGTQQTDSLGQFGFWVEKGSDLKIVVNSDDVLNNEINFSTKETNKDVEKITLNPTALRIITDKPIILNNLYYDFGADQITNESKLMLDSTLIVLMTKFSAIKIEIHSHTDNLGTDEYNNSLSLRRANNVKNYLISKGIDEYRLIAIGDGKNSPIAANVKEDGSDNPEGRQMNRRTEFLILKKSKD